MTDQRLRTLMSVQGRPCVSDSVGAFNQTFEERFIFLNVYN